MENKSILGRNIGGSAADIADAIAKKHARQHALDSASDHTGTLPTISVIIPGGIGTPTYDDMQDWLRMTRSSGRLTGGAVSAYVSPPTADGKVSITAMEGMIFTTNALGGTYIYFKQAAGTVDLTGLTDNTVYWIYFDWNSGTPQYAATATRSNIHEYDQFSVARVWRSGNTVEVQATGHSLYNKDRRSHNRLILKYGNMDRVSGGVISAHATPLRLSCDAGSWYVANTPFTTGAADTFEVWYKSGSATWVLSSEMTLFSDIFNGAAATTYETYQNGNSLAALGANKYGVYWIFLCPEGDLYVLLGTATYANVGAAQAATVPSTLPPYLVNWGRLVGRVIVKNAAAAFYSVESSFSTQFTLSAATDHSSLANLSANDHTQYLLRANDVGATVTEIDTGALANSDTVIPTSKAVTTAIGASSSGAIYWNIPAASSVSVAANCQYPVYYRMNLAGSITLGEGAELIVYCVSASIGEKGDTGATGAPGADGADGVSMIEAQVFIV
jgi:hypothetical protein